MRKVAPAAVAGTRLLFIPGPGVGAGEGLGVSHSQSGHCDNDTVDIGLCRRMVLLGPGPRVLGSVVSQLF